MPRGLLAPLLTALVLLAVACSGDESGEADAPPALTGEPAPTTTEPETTVETTTERAADDLDPPAPGGPLRLVEVVSGLESPVHAAAAAGEPGRLYVVEQAGRIRIVEDGQLLDEVFLDITGDVQSGGERGLLSVAFHPDYDVNGRFFVNFTNRGGDTRVTEFRGGDGGAPTEVRRLLAVDQPYGNHNGGQLVFGPDGLLYVGMGDGGSAGDPENRAQNLSSQLGKLLRVDVDAPGAEWEMVGYGLRNPWRFSFDRRTDDLWIADVGQGALEEIDFVAADDVGTLLNFGWDVFEGSREFENKDPTPGGPLVDPLTEYSHELGCSVTGGFVYRGKALRRQAWGRYFYGDYCSGRIWSVARWKGEVARRGHPFRVPQLTSFAEDLEGELYLLSGEGTVYRLARVV